MAKSSWKRKVLRRYPEARSQLVDGMWRIYDGPLSIKQLGRSLSSAQDAWQNAWSNIASNNPFILDAPCGGSAPDPGATP